MKCSSVALELNPEPNRWGLKVEANSKVVVITAVKLSHKSLTPKEVATSIKILKPTLNGAEAFQAQSDLA